MASFHQIIILFTLLIITTIDCKIWQAYFPVSTEIRQCCIDPVNAFILREWSGPCACQTLDQKWLRYKDWVELNGGYINPWIKFRYVHQYEDSPTLHNTSLPKSKNFKMHSHERGIFTNIERKYRRKLPAKALLFQIPFSITFSQFIISKYIRNATIMSVPQLNKLYFPKSDFFMPEGFPDWQEFRNRSIEKYRIDSIRGWLAIGLAWLREYTHELLPWIDLLPPPYYLPITWDKFQRDEFLLTGTRALRVINTLERELATAQPYVKMLGLTDEKLREAFAWVSSRSFGMSLDDVGGAPRSPVIPCGVDFPNHDIFVDSSLYYDHKFGLDRTAYNRHDVQTTEVIQSLIENKIHSDTQVRDIDFVSNYLWINNDFTNNSEIFINYGKTHTSGSRIALFGFIDAVHPNDHVNINIDIKKDDIHRSIKYKYFKTYWNATWSQQNKTKTESLDNMNCYEISDPNPGSWESIGRKPRYNQNSKPRQYIKEDERVYAPPLTLEYYGQKTIRVRGNFLRFLRLSFLPMQYFDSFTISSILNDFELNYLQTNIDPFIKSALNNLCKNELKPYPTTLYHDKLSLRKTERERKSALNTLEWNANRDLSETERLSQMLQSLDRTSLVLQYRIREKEFFDKCSRLNVVPTQSYLEAIRKRDLLKKQNKKKPPIKPQQPSGNTLHDFITNAFGNLYGSGIMNGSYTNVTVIDSGGGNVSNINGSVQTTTTTTIIEIDYDELLNEVENELYELGIDINLFEHEMDEDVWLQIINDAAEALLGGDVADIVEDESGSIEAIETVQDEEDDEEKEEEELSSISTPSIVRKDKLMIGTVRSAKKEMAQTIGWNSPNAGMQNSGSMENAQVFTIGGGGGAGAAGGQAFDLSSLFGGAFSNIQIGGGGQITFGGNQGGGVTINNLNLNELFGGNLGNIDNTNDNNDNSNALSTDTKPEIPETVPFSQLMNSATVSVFGLDENGNLVNVGNALNTNNLNLNSLFSGQGQRKKRHIHP